MTPEERANLIMSTRFLNVQVQGHPPLDLARDFETLVAKEIRAAEQEASAQATTTERYRCAKLAEWYCYLSLADEIRKGD